MKMEQTDNSETSAYKFQTPGNHPKESIQHSVHGESLKSTCKLALVQNIFLPCLDVVLCTANCCHVRTGLESEGHVSCATGLHVVRCPSANIVTTTVCNKT